jgi:zinc/manganese transport system substrate-binding protein
VGKRYGVRAGVLIFAAALIALIAGCDGGGDTGASGSSGKLRVVATTVQIEALAREVGGDLIDLHGIVPAGADPHEFEPTASDLVAIERADVILRHGIGLDDWLDDTLSAARDAAVSTVTSGISLQRGEAEHHGDEAGAAGAKEGAADPHVWHDPDNAKIMVRNIAAALVAADPANRAAYEANSTAYQATLDETKAQVQAIIDDIPAADRKLVTNHDAFGYFARAFGLEVVGAVIPSISTEAEPSAAETAKLLDTIKAEGVKAIFAESSVNPVLARTLAADAGVQIVDDLYGDSLGDPGSGAETIDGMLLFNARKIAEALKP